MLILVATPLSNVLLLFHLSVKAIAKSRLIHTDFGTGPLAITVVLKLKGPAGSLSLAPFSGVGLKEGIVGLTWSFVAVSNDALFGKVSTNGDRASRSRA